MTALIRIAQAAQLRHDLELLTLASLATLGAALAVISYTAWSTQ